MVSPFGANSARQTAKQCLNAGKQFLECEWLAEVVIGTSRQPLNTLFHSIAGSKKQHRRRLASLAELTEKRVSIRPRQPPIKYDQIPSGRC